MNFRTSSINHAAMAAAGLESIHVANLLILANYLAALPENYEHFDMGVFITTDESEPVPSMVTEDVLHRCGTVACAVGHGPAAGIAPKQGQYWWGYLTNFTGGEENSFDDNIYLQLFDDDWSIVDNTTKGAAARIYHFLAHGLSNLDLDDFEEMEHLMEQAYQYVGESV